MARRLLVCNSMTADLAATDLVATDPAATDLTITDASISSMAPLVDVDRLRIGIEMFKRSRRNTGSSDEPINLLLLKPNNSPEFIGRKLTFIDELIERSQRNAQSTCCVVSGKPPDVRRCHEGKCISFYLKCIECISLFFLHFQCISVKPKEWRL
jgi:hypothetical protein